MLKFILITSSIIISTAKASFVEEVLAHRHEILNDPEYADLDLTATCGPTALFPLLDVENIEQCKGRCGNACSYVHMAVLSEGTYFEDEEHTNCYTLQLTAQFRFVKRGTTDYQPIGTQPKDGMLCTCGMTFEPELGLGSEVFNECKNLDIRRELHELDPNVAVADGASVHEWGCRQHCHGHKIAVSNLYKYNRGIGCDKVEDGGDLRFRPTKGLCIRPGHEPKGNPAIHGKPAIYPKKPGKQITWKDEKHHCMCYLPRDEMTYIFELAVRLVWQQTYIAFEGHKEWEDAKIKFPLLAESLKNLY